MSAAPARAPIRVIGVGSPAGDDRVGWLVVDALRGTLSGREDVELLALDRPGVDLVRHISGAEHVVIVDAALAGSPPGTVHQFDRQGLARAPRPLSAHAVGVADALALARALGADPPRLHLLAVQAANTGPLDEPHPAVLAALPALTARVRELLAAS